MEDGNDGCVNLCSGEFNVAFDALNNGLKIRRGSWDDGKYIETRTNGESWIVFPGEDCSCRWHGPSYSESNASDWEIIS